jgi:hypothetical protein
MCENGWDKRYPSWTYEKHILVGTSREAAAKIVGIKPYRKQFKGTHDEAREFVLRSEVNRRHMTPEQQKAIADALRVRVADMRKKGESFRSIADKEKVSVGTIQRALSGSGVSGDTPDGKVIGKDGKAYPARAADNRCNKCSRLYPSSNLSVKGCEACKRLRLEAAAIKKGRTEPGTHEPRAKARQSGKPAYDYRKLNDFYGCLTREIDKMARPFDKINDPKTEELRKDLADWKTKFARVYSEYSHSNVTMEV